MVKILEEFPTVRQTFNLVPSMMVQVSEYAEGAAVDPFLQLALKPAETLTDADRAFLLRHSFYSDPQHMIYRYPRYGELFDAWKAQQAGAGSQFGVQDFRDLQMWSQLAWFDEEFQEHDRRGARVDRAWPQFHPGRYPQHGRQAARDHLRRAAGLPETGCHRPDRNLDHAVLPSHPAAALRFADRPGVASECPAAAALPLSAGCPPAVVHGAELHREELRRRTGRTLALRRLGLGRGLPHRRRPRLPVGSHR